MCLILKVKLLMLFLFNTLTSCETQTSLNKQAKNFRIHIQTDHKVM